MSIFKNLLGTVVPVRERREASGSLAVLNAEVVAPMNGDQFALVVISSASFNGTVEFTGQSDSTGSLYFPVPAYPVSPACAGGTVLLASQPILTHALVTANTLLVYSVPVSQLRALRVRCSAFSSGSAAVSITSDETLSLNANLNGGSAPSTLFITATGAASAAVTATLPLVTGLRHIIDEVSVVRSATAALTAAATPVVVTTTNLPGSPALTFGSDAAGIGLDKELKLPTGSGGLAASAIGTATTIVAPAYTGVIWRINVAYHLGL
jgi:hypothetical protein